MWYLPYETNVLPEWTINTINQGISSTTAAEKLTELTSSKYWVPRLFAKLPTVVLRQPQRSGIICHWRPSPVGPPCWFKPPYTTNSFKYDKIPISYRLREPPSTPPTPLGKCQRRLGQACISSNPAEKGPSLALVDDHVLLSRVYRRTDVIQHTSDGALR